MMCIRGWCKIFTSPLETHSLVCNPYVGLCINEHSKCINWTHKSHVHNCKLTHITPGTRSLAMKSITAHALRRLNRGPTLRSRVPLSETIWLWDQNRDRRERMVHPQDSSVTYFFDQRVCQSPVARWEMMGEEWRWQNGLCRYAIAIRRVCQ